MSPVSPAARLKCLAAAAVGNLEPRAAGSSGCKCIQVGVGLGMSGFN